MQRTVTQCDWPGCKVIENVEPAGVIVSGEVVGAIDVCPTHKESVRGLQVYITPSKWMKSAVLRSRGLSDQPTEELCQS